VSFVNCLQTPANDYTAPSFITPSCEIAPVDDLPPIHAYNAHSRHERQDAEQAGQFAQYFLDNPETTVSVYIARPNDFLNTQIASDVILATVNAMYPTSRPECATPAGEPGRFVLTPTKAADANVPCFVFGIGNLNRDVAHSLVTLRACSTTSGTIFVLPAQPRNYRLGVTLTNLTHGPTQTGLVRTAVADAIRRNAVILNCIVAGARIDHLANQLVDDDVLIDETLATLSIERAIWTRRTTGQNGTEVVHHVYIDNPMPPNRAREWERALATLQVRTLQGVGVAHAPTTCTYCRSRCHVFPDCAIRTRPGWLDTVALAAAAAPGQNIAPAPVPAAMPGLRAPGHAGRGGRGGNGARGGGRGTGRAHGGSRGGRGGRGRGN
jgi:uncharacterized membrane protein YgcG